MQQSNLKATWSTIKTVIGSKSRTNIPTSMKDSAGGEYTDFFVNIGHSLSKGFSSSNNQHRHFLTGSYNGSISLFLTDPFEIITIVNSLKNSRSEGVDGSNISIVKSCIDLIALPLSTIFNKSISTGIVPNQLKIAKGFQYLRLMIAVNLSIIDRSQFYHVFLKFLKSYFTIGF